MRRRCPTITRPRASRGSRRRLWLLGAALAASVLLVGSAAATSTPQPIPFSQSWTDPNLITADDDWSGVPGIVGYRGDGMTSANDVDPQTVLGDGSGTPVDVNANRPDPNSFSTGGLAEFDQLPNRTVAFQGSGTADAPHLVLHLDTTGSSNIRIAYTLRDVDGSADNAAQQVALHYRVGGTGNYVNVPAAYVADATTGPNQADLETPVSVLLPAAVDNQPLVELRVITTNATGNDEWVGVDDISVVSTSEDAAPAVSSTDPPNGATGVPVDANVEITFSEPVDVAGDWFSIDCATSGLHSATVTGGPVTFTLDPDADFAQAETCTVTIVGSAVSDQDSDDPPDTMDADYSFAFTTAAGVVQIHAVQGAAHLSPLAGQTVAVEGIVTTLRLFSGQGFYLQGESPDGDAATSEGVFVFTGSTPSVSPGDELRVSGTVSEFRPGGSSSTNLTTTELTSPTVTVLSSGNPLPAATVIGLGGRVPPTEIIEDDAQGDVETSGVFDPAEDGIDFYESLEGMLVQLNDAVAVGPTNDFGEIPVVSDGGASASVRTPRGGIVIRPNDFNPERIFFDDVLAPMPTVDVRDTFPGAVSGVLDYSFGNFKLLPTASPTPASSGLDRESTAAAGTTELSFATVNVENLDPGDPPSKFAELADRIVNNLRSPDLIGLEEVQDNNGPQNDDVVDASATYAELIAAIAAAGGPAYDVRQIDPVDDQDGGEPGGNIRVGFLFRTDRGLAFVDRPGGDATTPTGVVPGVAGPQLTFSPGRIQPNDPAFTNSRKPLAGEFTVFGSKLFVVANHFNSKGGDQPLFGRFQPPARSSEVQRHQQAQIVHDFVEEIVAADPNANVVVLGDLNDFVFSQTLEIVRGDELQNGHDTLPENEQYTYVFEGNSQALDHILLTDRYFGALELFDVVHVNAEFATRPSDHDPLVAHVCADQIAPRLTVSASPRRLRPPNHRYRTVVTTLEVDDNADPSPEVELVSATSNEPDDAPGESDGHTQNDVVVVDDTTFRLRAERDTNGTGRIYTLTYRAVDACGNEVTRSAEVRVPL